MAMPSIFDLNFGQNGSAATSKYLQNTQANTGNASIFGGDSNGPAGGLGLGMNLDTLKLGIGGIQTIGNLWNAWQANKLAKEQFNYTKDITNQNMTNSLQTYNTSLEDRIRARGFTEGQTADQQQSYIDKNQLKRTY